MTHLPAPNYSDNKGIIAAGGGASVTINVFVTAADGTLPAKEAIAAAVYEAVEAVKNANDAPT